MTFETPIDGDTLFRLHRTRPDRGTVHGTAVAMSGRGVLVLGASGTGKTGLAAQLMVMGGHLVSDDLVVLIRDGETLKAARPDAGPAALELRGLGIVTVPTVGPVPLAGVLQLGPSSGRLPDAEVVTLLGCRLPLLRHPARYDTAAKLSLWLTTP